MKTNKTPTANNMLKDGIIKYLYWILNLYKIKYLYARWKRTKTE